MSAGELEFGQAQNSKFADSGASSRISDLRSQIEPDYR